MIQNFINKQLRKRIRIKIRLLHTYNIEKTTHKQYDSSMDIDSKIYQQMIDEAKTNTRLEEIRIHLLGKNGVITNYLKTLEQYDIETRKTYGKTLNEIKTKLSTSIEEKKKLFNQKKVEDNFDYSIPFNALNLRNIPTDLKLFNTPIGKRHIISTSIEKLDKIFQAASFQFINGPDIEDVYYNFEALNMPIEHPARDNNDTFYMQEPKKLLRTHVTAVQIRLLEQMKETPEDIKSHPRSYSIGRVYRNDTHDATHACSFHQIEGVIIEEGVTMQHLKGFLEYILEEFFEQKTSIRFRPSYFPFTEPSCEVDIFIKNNSQKLEITTQGNGKPLELGGCGIIHSSILERFNQKDKQAFAFGMGLERLVMIKHGIANLHDLYDNHIPTLNYISQTC